MVNLALSTVLCYGSRPLITGAILFRSKVASPGSAVARKNRSMAFQIACAGRFDWDVENTFHRGNQGCFDWAIAPRRRREYGSLSHLVIYKSLKRAIRLCVHSGGNRAR